MNVETLLLARYLEENSSGLTMIGGGIVNFIVSPIQQGMPEQVPLVDQTLARAVGAPVAMSILVRLSVEPEKVGGEVNIGINIVDPDGKLVWTFARNFPIQKNADKPAGLQDTLQLIIPIVLVPTTLGPHSIEILENGHRLKSLQFNYSEPPKPTVFYPRFAQG